MSSDPIGSQTGERPLYLDPMPEGHEGRIEGADKMCADGFEREFWRWACKCGHNGPWRFWRSYADDDRITHEVDVKLEVRRG